MYVCGRLTDGTCHRGRLQMMRHISRRTYYCLPLDIVSCVLIDFVLLSWGQKINSCVVEYHGCLLKLTQGITLGNRILSLPILKVANLNCSIQSQIDFYQSQTIPAIQSQPLPTTPSRLLWPVQKGNRLASRYIMYCIWKGIHLIDITNIPIPSDCTIVS